MFTIDGFVEECLGALDAERPAVAVAEVVRRAVTDRTIGSVLTPDRSNFGVLHRSDRLTVLHVALPPTVGSTAHEHLMWAVVGMHRGQEDNTFFRKDGDGLIGSGGRSLSDGEVLVMGDDTIHAIRNPRAGYASALHVYGGDLVGAPRREWVDDQPRPFDREGPVRTAGRVRAEEERLGRPLTADEVAAVLAAG